MRIWNRILLAGLIVGLLGTMMPVAAATVSPNHSQWTAYWRFVSPKPRPDCSDLIPNGAGMEVQSRQGSLSHSSVETGKPLPQCAEAQLVWLIAYWLFGVVF
jgi:hypothetical protein